MLCVCAIPKPDGPLRPKLNHAAFWTQHNKPFSFHPSHFISTFYGTLGSPTFKYSRFIQTTTAIAFTPNLATEYGTATSQHTRHLPTSLPTPQPVSHPPCPTRLRVSPSRPPEKKALTDRLIQHFELDISIFCFFNSNTSSF